MKKLIIPFCSLMLAAPAGATDVADGEQAAGSEQDVNTYVEGTTRLPSTYVEGNTLLPSSFADAGIPSEK